MVILVKQLNGSSNQVRTKLPPFVFVSRTQYTTTTLLCQPEQE